ncbi:MAG: hypothetical protein HY721_16195 [Planctomycetes bacterium]|nr:hypothetical protein [Planctomycetota bacterium]
MALDQRGNAFVLALRSVLAVQDDLVVKYDPDGRELWSAIGTASLGLEVDREGNAYVLSLPDKDTAVTKYSGEGKALWTAFHDHERDWFAAMALDRDGNLYVAGSSAHEHTIHHQVLLKYNPEGDLVSSAHREVRVYGRVSDLALGPEGDVYVAGSEDGELATVKYVPTGLRNAFVRSDCNGNGDLGGVTDAVFLLSYNFHGGPEPLCLAACDANGDGQLTGQVTDAVYLLAYSFLGGLAPPDPFPACGPGRSPADEALGCRRAPEVCR